MRWTTKWVRIGSQDCLISVISTTGMERKKASRMILDPDFLDHWKTRMFIDIMGEEIASNYILRLWFHCQTRRSISFPKMSGQALKAICRYPGDGNKLRQAMVDCGFIELDGDSVTVSKFAENNDKMFAAWGNGSKGGRPRNENEMKKKPNDNPTVTQWKPNDNPTITQREPNGNRREGGKEGREEEGEVGLEETARPPVFETTTESASPVLDKSRTCTSQVPSSPQSSVLSPKSPIPLEDISSMAVESYQRRRYKRPDRHASYYAAVLQEACDIFSGHSDPAKALEKFQEACRAPPSMQLPADASFSDIAIYCGLKHRKVKAGTVPRQVYRDYTAERLSGGAM